MLNGPYWFTDGNGVDADGDPCVVFGDGYSRHLSSGGHDGDDSNPVCCSKPLGGECPKYEYTHCGGIGENCCTGGKCHSHDMDGIHPTCDYDTGKCVSGGVSIICCILARVVLCRFI